MSNVFFVELDIPRPDHFLGAGSGTRAAQTCRVMTAFEPIAAELVVVDDVNSTLVSTKLGAPLAPVEAGLRRGDRSMSEEINRIVTDRVSGYLSAPSPDAVANFTLALAVWQSAPCPPPWSAIGPMHGCRRLPGLAPPARPGRHGGRSQAGSGDFNHA
jgi:hypothetical protein